MNCDEEVKVIKAWESILTRPGMYGKGRMTDQPPKLHYGETSRMPAPQHEGGWFRPYIPLVTRNSTLMGGKTREDLPDTAALYYWDSACGRGKNSRNTELSLKINIALYTGIALQVAVIFWLLYDVDSLNRFVGMGGFFIQKPLRPLEPAPPKPELIWKVEKRSSPGLYVYATATSSWRVAFFKHMDWCYVAGLWHDRRHWRCDWAIAISVKRLFLDVQTPAGTYRIFDVMKCVDKCQDCVNKLFKGEKNEERNGGRQEREWLVQGIPA